MARIRSIKPEFWTDERIGECTALARLLFIATWNFADDAGGLDRSAKQLKAQAFPYDDLDCEPLIQELLHAGLLIEYERGGKKYLHIKGFQTHQKVDHPGKPRVPSYHEPSRALQESSPKSREDSRGLTEDSRLKGREGIKRETLHSVDPLPLPDTHHVVEPLERAPAKRAQGQRIPEGFAMSPEHRSLAAELQLDAAREFAQFVDYWHAASGRTAIKRDWDAALRVWFRKSAERHTPRINGHDKPKLTWRPEDDDVSH